MDIALGRFDRDGSLSEFIRREIESRTVMLAYQGIRLVDTIGHEQNLRLETRQTREYLRWLKAYPDNIFTSKEVAEWSPVIEMPDDIELDAKADEFLFNWDTLAQAVDYWKFVRIDKKVTKPRRLRKRKYTRRPRKPR